MAKKEVIRTPELLDLGKFMKAPVSPAVRANGFIFTGGYVPLDPKTGKAVLGPIEDQARRTLDNLRQVLELAGSLGLVAEERSLAPGEFAAADLLFVTNSVRFLRPVSALDGKSWPDRFPDAFFALRSAVADRVADTTFFRPSWN